MVCASPLKGDTTQRIVDHSTDTMGAMRFHRSAWLLVAGVIALSACASTAPSSDDTTTTSSINSVTSTQTTEVTTSAIPDGYEAITTADGRTRTFRVVDLAEGEPAPLLFVLHGFGGTAEGLRQYVDLESRLSALVDEGVIVVYPNGSGSDEGLPQSWNAGGCCPFAIYDMVDDVAFFDELLDVIEARYEIDERRVWVVGHSNGGMMAYRLACQLSSRVTAIGVAAGALMIDQCSPTRPVSALHLHGDLDAVVPVAGGETAGIAFPSARDSFTRFATANACIANDTAATCPTGIEVSIITDPQWTHDWQSAWNDLFVEFLVRQSSE